MTVNECLLLLPPEIRRRFRRGDKTDFPADPQRLLHMRVEPTHQIDVGFEGKSDPDAEKQAFADRDWLENYLLSVL
jgi:hypothetical protein